MNENIEPNNASAAKGCLEIFLYVAAFVAAGVGLGFLFPKHVLLIIFATVFLFLAGIAFSIGRSWYRKEWTDQTRHYAKMLGLTLVFGSVFHSGCDRKLETIDLGLIALFAAAIYPAFFLGCALARRQVEETGSYPGPYVEEHDADPEKLHKRLLNSQALYVLGMAAIIIAAPYYNVLISCPARVRAAILALFFALSSFIAALEWVKKTSRTKAIIDSALMFVVLLAFAVSGTANLSPDTRPRSFRPLLTFVTALFKGTVSTEMVTYLVIFILAMILPFILGLSLVSRKNEHLAASSITDQR